MAKADAKKYSEMISASKTGGESRVAMANAQKVLDSPGMIEMYLKNAKDARDELVAAKKDADDAATAALDKAIEEIDGYIETIQGLLDERGNDSLDSIISLIKGDSNKTASDIGQDVAMKIFDALKPPDSGTVPAGLNNHPSTDQAEESEVAAATMKSDNHIGKSWEDIVGSDNIIETRIDAGTDISKSVKAASVDGESVGVHSLPANAIPDECTATASAPCAEGAQSEVSWKGIDGIIFCVGDDCKLTGTGTSRALTGSWYFTPDPITFHIFQDDRTYKNEVYAEYGYWLDEADTATHLVHTFSRGVNEPSTPVPGSWAANTDLDAKATYSGNAIGLYSKFSGSGENVIRQSGHFSAEVELEAVFADTSELSGAIDNFRDADNNMIDSRWSVDLEATGAGGVL